MVGYLQEENSDTLDLDQRPKTSDSFQSLLGGAPSLSVELKNECEIWKQRFPHLRYCTVYNIHPFSTISNYKILLFKNIF